ncbi:hypothetical protein SLA2020_059240 [Shorea laevis]
MADDPEGLAAAASAILLHSRAFFLISLPFSSSINSLTSLSTSSLLTSLFISIPIPHSVQQNRQLVCCSAENGQQIIGTPADVLSRVEFHPPCVKNPPMAGLLRTCSCAHQVANKPLFLVFVTNSGGKIAASPATKSGLMIHKNS